MKGIPHIVYYICFLLVIVSCSSTKFVGEGEYLLDKVEIISDNKTYKGNDLKPYLRQQPNFKVFGLMKWQLFVYDWSGKNEKNWINKQLRRIGEAPVIMDTTLVEQSADELQRFFVNKGYVNADVSFSIDTTRKKKAIVTYQIETNIPYRIEKYKMNLSDPEIDSIARLKAPHRSPFSKAFRTSTDDYTPLVKEGTLFDRDMLDKERQRITTLLRRRGYYAFNRDYLVYIADSSFNRNIVDLDMLLKPYRMQKPGGAVVDTLHRQYYIKDVSIVTDYNPLTWDGSRNSVSSDSVSREGVDILYGINGRSIRPGVLFKSNFITPGKLYNERNVEQTYASFATLRALRNVNIRFTEIEENDTMKLNCTILTSPAKLQGFGVDIEGTNSAGDLGFASSLNYQHRNIFKGSEILSAKVRGAYEALSNQSVSNSYWEIGTEAAITFPRFLFPFLGHDFRRKIRATSELKVSYSFQTRPEFKRAILSGGWSYIWQDRSNVQARHIFKLLDIDYVYLPKIETSFKDSLPESTRLYNFTNQFVVGSGYTYSFNNYNPQNRQRNTHSLRVSFEMAGNLLYGLSKLTHAKKNKENRYELFGIAYSQFVKGDVDFSKSIVLDNRNKLAFHVGVGVGYPYGNTKMLPFERSYFSGGANSVRGWSVRSLGPGSLSLDSVKSFADQVGDIRLDLNLEYRTKLFWKFEMAAYIDAGNIWTMRADKDKPNSNFDFSRFYKEIAVSYGLGLRLDFDFFLIRLDTGMKAYDPQQLKRDRWALFHPNFQDNFALHFAVGYPF